MASAIPRDMSTSNDSRVAAAYIGAYSTVSTLAGAFADKTHLERRTGASLRIVTLSHLGLYAVVVDSEYRARKHR